jgi:translation initiation factor IF-2
MESLKHLKSDVDEAKKGLECGIAIQGFTAFEEGDVLQSYEESLRVRTL